EALLGVAVAQILLTNGLSDLLVNFPARVGVFDCEFSHYCVASGVTMVAPGGIWNLNELSLTAGFSFSAAKANVSTDLSWPMITMFVITNSGVAVRRMSS